MKRALIVTIAVFSVAGGLFAIFRRPFQGLPPLTSRQDKTIAFAVIGDTETHNDLYARALNDAKARGARFVLHTGDLVEHGTDEELLAARAVAERVGLPAYVAVGNHDYPDNLSRAPFERIVNAANMAVEYGGVRFVILDNADRNIGFSEETLAWLDAEFRAHPATPHVLVYHRPFDLPFSALTGDDETRGSRASNERFRSLLSLAKIVMIFNGHVHAYVPYTLDGIRAYVTGGGGGEAQEELAFLANAAPHYLMATMRDGRVETEVIEIR